jgi:hypothetical protein
MPRLAKASMKPGYTVCPLASMTSASAGMGVSLPPIATITPLRTTSTPFSIGGAAFDTIFAPRSAYTSGKR